MLTSTYNFFYRIRQPLFIFISHFYFIEFPSQLPLRRKYSVSFKRAISKTAGKKNLPPQNISNPFSGLWRRWIETGVGKVCWQKSDISSVPMATDKKRSSYYELLFFCCYQTECMYGGVVIRRGSFPTVSVNTAKFLASFHTGVNEGARVYDAKLDPNYLSNLFSSQQHNQLCSDIQLLQNKLICFKVKCATFINPQL